MIWRAILSCLLLLVLPLQALSADDPIMIVGHASLGKTDLSTVQRLYSGRAVSIGDKTAIPINLRANSPVRESFLSAIMGQSEEQYTGYWLVRRYVGKGTPPEEVSDVAEVLRLIATMPGAVGYVPLSALPSGANVIFRR